MESHALDNPKPKDGNSTISKLNGAWSSLTTRTQSDPNTYSIHDDFIWKYVCNFRNDFDALSDEFLSFGLNLLKHRKSDRVMWGSLQKITLLEGNHWPYIAALSFCTVWTVIFLKEDIGTRVVHNSWSSIYLNHVTLFDLLIGHWNVVGLD